MHTPFTADVLRRLLAEADERALSAEAVLRLRCFLHYVESGLSVADTCTHFGISRSTFHRWMQRFDPADVHTLEERPSTPHHVRQRTVSTGVVDLIRAYREEQPHLGKEYIATLLRERHGITLSPSTVGRVIADHGFYFAPTALHCKRRSALISTTPAMMPVTPLPTPESKWRTVLRRSAIITSIATNILVIIAVGFTLKWEWDANSASITHVPVEKSSVIPSSSRDDREVRTATGGSMAPIIINVTQIGESAETSLNSTQKAQLLRHLNNE